MHWWFHVQLKQKNLWRYLNVYAWGRSIHLKCIKWQFTKCPPHFSTENKPIFHFSVGMYVTVVFYRVGIYIYLTVIGTYPQVGTQVKKIYNHKSLLVGLYHDKKSWFRPKIKKLILARSQNHAFSNHAFSTLLRFQNNMLVRNLAITMHFLGVNGLLWMKSTS